MTSLLERNHKILFLILGSDAAENERDLSCQKGTWIRQLSDEESYLILRGGSKTGIHRQGDTLFLQFEETYPNILNKTIAGIRWALENLEFDFLVRTNVSTYFSTILLQQEMKCIDSSKHFFGGYIDYSKVINKLDQGIFPYITGTSMILSKKTAGLLVDTDTDEYEGIPDDVAISLMLKNKGISYVSMKRNNLGQSHFFIPNFQIRLKTSSLPLLASERMFLVDNYFNSSTTAQRIKSYLYLMKYEFGILFTSSTEIVNFFLFIGTRLLQTLRRINKLDRGF